MAKKKGSRGSKDKGRNAYARQDGLARLRRANVKSRTRVGDLTRHQDDDSFLDRIGDERNSHTGENLLMRFNRVARDEHHGSGERGIAGTVSGFDGLFVLVRDESGHERPCQMRRVIKKMLAGVKSPLAVGDRVRVHIGPEGDAVITALEPRRNQLARADSHNKALSHVFAANVDHLVVVGALALPDFKPGLIDRYLVLAHFNDITPVVVLNKCDIGDPAPWAELYASLGYSVFATVATPAATGGDIDALRAHLAGTACVFVGQSGVGKSSLINALYPAIDARIGDVSLALHKGRHTTTNARSYPLADGGRLIDTPGIRECGLSGMSPLDVALLYPDIAALHGECRFNDCTHLLEPDCAVRTAVEEGRLAISRYASYCSILEEDLDEQLLR